MTTQLTPMQSFQEKVKNRLVSDIGDLIPDEALIEMVKVAMEEAFFKDRETTTGNGYHKSTETKPSIFIEIVTELMQPRFDKVLREWMDDNSDKIMAEMRSFTEANASDQILKALQRVFHDSMAVYQNNIVDAINQRTDNGVY